MSDSQDHWPPATRNLRVGDEIHGTARQISGDGIIVELDTGGEALLDILASSAINGGRALQGITGKRISAIVTQIDPEARLIFIQVPDADRIDYLARDARLLSFSPTSHEEPTNGFGILWTPDALSPDEYADLVVALGDLVRQHGADGVARVLSEEIPSDVLAPVARR